MKEILFFLSIILVCVFFVSETHQLGVVTESSPTATVPDTLIAFEDFNATGTLVFYPNNVGPVPYLFYENQRGNTAAKALVFPYVLPPVNFSSWTGARISIVGHLDQEHVNVTHIQYVSAP